jgi:hypothetical protein
MLLKGRLAKKRKLSLSELEKMKHKLKVLWREYKKASSWTPGAFIGTNRFAKQAIRRHNKHARYLTKFP